MEIAHVEPHEELNASHDEFVPASGGKPRLKRLPPGELEKRIRLACNEWSGAAGSLTVVAIRRAVEVRFGRPVSDNGVDACLRRWGRIGAAEIGESPVSFEGWTEAAAKLGFRHLYAADKEFREQQRAVLAGAEPSPTGPRYEPAPNHEASEWEDAEARQVDG